MADNQFLNLDGIRYLWDKIANTFVKKDGKKVLSDNNFSTDEKEKLAALENYELPAADENTLGGVKIGSGLSIDSDNKLSATYELPTATPSRLGGVKVGSGLEIDGNGMMNAVNTYTLPVASPAYLGGVRVGPGLNIDGAGVLSAVQKCEWQNVVNPPTTLSGYGITDAAGAAAVTALNGEITTVKNELNNDNIREQLLLEEIPGTSQQITFSQDGNVDQIIHKADQTTVRTDTYTFGENTVTEVRTLATGQKLTIVTNTETLVTTTTYAAA